MQGTGYAGIPGSFSRGFLTRPTPTSLMKCDLCGVKVACEDAFTYEDVTDSRLCKACYAMVTEEKIEKIGEPETITICPVCNAENIVTESSLENLRCVNCENDLQIKVEFIELIPLEKGQVRCPSCKAANDDTATFCETCGLWLSNRGSITNKPVAGIVSILSIPVGILVALLVYKVLPKYDFLGFATAILIGLVLSGAVVSGLVSGAIALRPTMNSRTNPILGVVGVILTVLAIGCFFLFNR